MHFKSLELFGFKSFANKTDLNFEPGVTAIVGPNGCGKSNISDAIKWVLGETSAREVRGLRMEDVIFNGTDGKEPLGFAEVSLTITNQPKILPTEYDEVTISRRVFRSGESEYFINKSPVRLKDIQELFMGTGIGTSTYSLMEQGRIDQLLDSRPEERRHVFEEAAGITRYKSKKKEALRKLEQTEANLLRINDVVIEVRRQINSIERQANKAKKYKEDFEKLKELEILYASYEFGNLNRDENTICSDKISLAEKEGRLAAALNEFGSSLTSSREELSGIEQRLYDAKSTIVNIESQIERNKDKTSNNYERIEEFRARITDLGKELDTGRTRLLNLENEVTRLSLEANSFRANEENKKAEMEQKTISLDLIADDIKASQANIEKAKSCVVDIAQGHTKTHNELTKLAANIQHLSARQRRIEVERRKVEEERSLSLQKLRESNSAIENLSLNIAGLNEKKNLLEGDLNKTGGDISNSESRLQELNSEFASEKSRLAFLEDLRAKYEGFSSGVKSILKEIAKGSPVTDGVLGVIADLIEPFQGYEAVIEAALGDFAQAIVVKDKQRAKELIKFLDENSLGRVTFIPLENIASHPIKSDILDYIKTSETVKPALRYLLTDVYLADNIETASAEAEEKENAVRMVTKNGEVIEKGLFCGGKIQRATGVDALGRAEDFGLIGRDARIKELRINIDALQTNIESFNKELLEKKERRDILRLEMNSAAEEIHKTQIDYANKISEKTGVEDSIAKLNEEDSVLNIEWGEVKSEIDALCVKEGDLKNQLSSLDEEDIKIQEMININQENVSLKLKEREDNIVLITQLRTELESLKDKEGAILNALNMMGVAFEDEKTDIATKERQIEESSTKISELQIESEGLFKLNETLLANKEVILRETEEIQNKKALISDSISRLESEIKRLQGELDQTKQHIHTLNIRTTEFNFKKNNLQERLQQVYKIDINAQNVVIPEDTNWQETLDKITAMKSKLEQMGAVNLVAIEEHKELQDRYNFLTTQQQDLSVAKDDLHKAINKINRTTRELFIETFEKIQVEFRNMFRVLFNGGDAELMLIDQSDILESGIEIIARPPSKKPQSISLLSGGERSMTAIALLFAIFKVKPSPFCVLDEMDAALDESNINRFCVVLKDFVKTSQFIMITHNKKTISIADVMYGITMEESGVSKIVSVKFSDEVNAAAVKSVDETRSLTG